MRLACVKVRVSSPYLDWCWNAWVSRCKASWAWTSISPVGSQGLT